MCAWALNLRVINHGRVEVEWLAALDLLYSSMIHPTIPGGSKLKCVRLVGLAWATCIGSCEVSTVVKYTVTN